MQQTNTLEIDNRYRANTPRSHSKKDQVSIALKAPVRPCEPVKVSSPMPRPRLLVTTKAVPIPVTRAETYQLRELLETYLNATQALLQEQQRTLHRTLRAIDDERAQLRAELRALTDARAPWVHAMTEVRALLFVALRELIVGDNEAGLSLQLPAQPKSEPQGAQDKKRPF